MPTISSGSSIASTSKQWERNSTSKIRGCSKTSQKIDYRVRSVVSSMLAHKRTLDNKAALSRTEFRANAALVASLIGILIAIASMIVALMLH